LANAHIGIKEAAAIRMALEWYGKESSEEKSHLFVRQRLGSTRSSQRKQRSGNE
ncbi:unnamed protein product, partial [Oikopleura dioica]